MNSGSLKGGFSRPRLPCSSASAAGRLRSAHLPAAQAGLGAPAGCAGALGRSMYQQQLPPAATACAPAPPAQQLVLGSHVRWQSTCPSGSVVLALLHPQPNTGQRTSLVPPVSQRQPTCRYLRFCDQWRGTGTVLRYACGKAEQQVRKAHVSMARGTQQRQAALRGQKRAVAVERSRRRGWEMQLHSACPL